MAFSTGRSSESSSFKRYIGVGSFKSVVVNPTAKELSELYGREITTEPVYTSLATVKDSKGNDKEVDAANISIYLRTDPAVNNGIDLIVPIKFTIFNTPWYSSKDGVVKAQIIDAYGRTAWATADEIKANAIPVYKNGRAASISSGYRTAYRGEAELTDFIIKMLNIPPVQNYNKDTNTWSLVANPEDSRAQFDKEQIKAFFKGNVSALRDALKAQPENHIKAAVGIQTSDNGKLYQTMYSRLVLRNGSKKIENIYDSIVAAKASGSLKNVEFFVLENGTPMLTELREYAAQPTTFTPVETSQMPEYDSEDSMSDMPFED